MYDTLKIVKNNIDNVDQIISNMNDIKEIYNRTTGEVTFKGKIENLGCKVSSLQLSLQGSLPKFYLGNNLHSLTLQGTKEGFQKLSEITGQNLIEANVQVLHFGYCFKLDYECQYYFALLGEMPQMNRRNMSKGVLFSNNQKSLSFYDKISEMKRWTNALPVEVLNSNILRYEQKYKKNVRRQLKINSLTCRDLLDQETAHYLLRRYKHDFGRIHKVSRFDDEEFISINWKKLKDVQNLFVRRALKDESLDSMVNLANRCLTAQNAKPYQKSRIKGYLREVFNIKASSSESGLEGELQSKISQLEIA